jgi:hypothetical protein
MHDFRPMKKQKSEFGFLSHKMTPDTREKRLNSQNPGLKTTLDPILETEDAQAIHL